MKNKQRVIKRMTDPRISILAGQQPKLLVDKKWKTWTCINPGSLATVKNDR